MRRGLRSTIMIDRWRFWERNRSGLSASSIALVCGLIGGCVEIPPPVECVSDADCDDGAFCNGAESCLLGFCVDAEPACDSQSSNFGCDEAADMCVTPECVDDSACDDSVFCNGRERCRFGVCVDGPVPCALLDACHACDEAAEACMMSECAVDGQCDDKLFCTGVEMCQDCACVPGERPCAAGQFCDETGDVCYEPEMRVSCGCVGGGACDSVDPDRSIALRAVVTQARGDVRYQWTASTGTFDDATSAEPVLTVDGSAIGSSTIEVVVTDVVGGEVVSQATCRLILQINAVDDLFPNAGADRIFFPNATDFGGRTPFSEGAYLASGQAGGAVRTLIAVSNRGREGSLTYQWELVSVPNGARFEDVGLANADSQVLTYWIAPNPNVEMNTIVSTGQSATISNVVAPGSYTFRITVTDLESGDAAADEVVHTLIPGFAIPAAGH